MTCEILVKIKNLENQLKQQQVEMLLAKCSWKTACTFTTSTTGNSSKLTHTDDITHHNTVGAMLPNYY